MNLKIFTSGFSLQSFIESNLIGGRGGGGGVDSNLEACSQQTQQLDQLRLVMLDFHETS